MESTLTAVRDLVTKRNVIHMARLAAIRSGKVVAPNGDCEFVWCLAAKPLARFPHHANLMGSTVWSLITHSFPEYIGTIPDFALDRAEKGLELGLGAITIHSMLPLLIHADPVMIGWFCAPSIRIEAEKVVIGQGDELGVVLAIWDNEQELEL